jgi:hypothetical protein
MQGDVAEPITRTRRGLRRARGAFIATVAATLLGCIAAAPASAGPSLTRLVYAAGEIVPIPAVIPHEEGDMVDRRIVPDLRWISQHFPIYVSDGYSGPLPDGEHVGCHGCHVKHSDHYNGLAVDLVPLHWSDKCDVHWRGITRLAHWAEPVQNHPVSPFRWVGYEGDAGHGCGNHLHLSWEHSPAPQFQLAEWVEVFPVQHSAVATKPQPETRRSHPKPPPGPRGGISAEQTGGVALGD